MCKIFQTRGSSQNGFPSGTGHWLETQKGRAQMVSFLRTSVVPGAECRVHGEQRTYVCGRFHTELHNHTALPW